MRCCTGDVLGRRGRGEPSAARGGVKAGGWRPPADSGLSGRSDAAAAERVYDLTIGEASVTVDGKAYDREAVLKHVGQIDSTVETIVKMAEKDNISTAKAADSLAEQRLRDIELLCARRDEATRAAQTIDGHTAELATLPEQAVPEPEDERAERADIAAARTRVQDELSRIAVVRDEALTRTAEQVALLPPPLDAAGLNTARKEVEAAMQAATAAEAAESRARQRDERAKALREQLDDIAAKEGAAIRAAKPNSPSSC